MADWPHQAQTFELRKHIFAVRNELKAGWSEHIYHHASEVEVQAKWRERPLAFHKAPFMLIEAQILVHICSLPGFPPVYEFARAKTYLENLGLEFALLVNFGHKQLQIFGILNN